MRKVMFLIEAIVPDEAEAEARGLIMGELAEYQVNYAEGSNITSVSIDTTSIELSSWQQAYILNHPDVLPILNTLLKRPYLHDK